MTNADGPPVVAVAVAFTVVRFLPTYHHYIDIIAITSIYSTTRNAHSLRFDPARGAREHRVLCRNERADRPTARAIHADARQQAHVRLSLEHNKPVFPFAHLRDQVRYCRARAPSRPARDDGTEARSGTT